MFISLILIWFASAVMSAGSTIAAGSLGRESSLEPTDLRSDLIVAANRVQQRESAEALFKTNGSLDLSWNDAELFS